MSGAEEREAGGEGELLGLGECSSPYSPLLSVDGIEERLLIFSILSTALFSPSSRFVSGTSLLLLPLAKPTAYGISHPESSNASPLA